MHLPHFRSNANSAPPLAARSGVPIALTSSASPSSSFIPDDELEEVPFPDLQQVRSDQSEVTLCEADPPRRGRHVQFCPLALLCTCAPDGEKDDVLASSDRAGRARIAVRTFSVDAANIQSSSKKVWEKVTSSISASFQPVFAPEAAFGSSSVAQFSSSRSVSDDFFAKKRTNEPGSYHKEDDPTFIPNHNRVSIRLPSLSRQRPRRQSTSDVPRSCLKSPNHPPSPPSSIPPLVPEIPIPRSSSPTAIVLPIVNSPSDLTPTTLASSLAYAHSPPLPSRLQDANHLAHILSVPLSPCCSNCHTGAEYGVCDEWREQFSKSARRKLREDAKNSEGPSNLHERIRSGEVKSESRREVRDVEPVANEEGVEGTAATV